MKSYSYHICARISENWPWVLWRAFLFESEREAKKELNRFKKIWPALEFKFIKHEEE